MSKIELLKVFLNQRLSAAAEEIFGAVEQTIADYHEECSRTKEENDRLLKLLDDVLKPEIKLHRTDLQHLTASGKKIPAENELYEKWKPLSLGQEDPELTQIKKEKVELGASQVKEELHWLEQDLSPATVERDCHQNSSLFTHLASTSTEQINTEFDEDLQQLFDSGKKLTSEKQLCEKWSPPTLRQEEPELTQIKKRQEELATSKAKVQPHWLEETLLSPALVKSDSHQDPSVSPHLHQPQIVEKQQGDIFSTTVEQIKTENDKEYYSISEPNNDSQPIFAENPQCSVSQTETFDDTCLERGPHSVGSKRIQTLQGQSSCIGTNNERKSVELSHVKLPVCESQSHAAVPICYCKVCGTSFNSMFSLVSHVKMHLMDEEHICGVCEKHFDSMESLQGHLQTHMDTGFSCHICHKRFRMKTEVVMHMGIHKGENPFKCLSCGKDFRNSSNLTKHIRSHTGEKPYQCPHCSKRFSNSSNMKVHIRCHTGEKPFACRFCGKGFIQKAKMELHIMIHTGEKPHRCSYCGKCFRHGSDMKVHMRRHTGEKPLSCSLCLKSFAAHGSLRVHMRTHTGEKPYGCPVCKKCFISSSALGAHQKIHSLNVTNTI
ncbi:zinc finger protein 570 isoform X1 [Esox lucius]|uniref:zinc finger protein 570 isoform X1 n=1 Tax=Esox lucius TaxID=8010 RepID=UPI00147766AE|nr:zinc finger protein 570 isoform X1 [Esox lucius]